MSTPLKIDTHSNFIHMLRKVGLISVETFVAIYANFTRQALDQRLDSIRWRINNIAKQLK